MEHQTRRYRPPQGTKSSSFEGKGWRVDTLAPVAPTYLAKENPVLKKATSHANLIVQSSLELYRELTLSALSLVRRLAPRAAPGSPLH